MGSLCSKPSTVPSVQTPENIQPSQPISTPNRTTSTPPSRPGTPKNTRTRALSQSAALSQRNHHDDGMDYPPPLSGCDVFTSQHPDRRSRKSSSGGTSPVERTRSVSMDLRRAPSQSSVRRNRTASTATAVYDGHRRVTTKSMSSATGQTPAGRQGGRSRFPFALQSLLPNDFRYAGRP